MVLSPGRGEKQARRLTGGPDVHRRPLHTGLFECTNCAALRFIPRETFRGKDMTGTLRCPFMTGKTRKCAVVGLLFVVLRGTSTKDRDEGCSVCPFFSRCAPWWGIMYASLRRRLRMPARRVGEIRSRAIHNCPTKKWRKQQPIR